MRALAFSSLAIFASTAILGVLFKIMHWPGANIGLVIGVAGLALITVPSFAFYKFRSTKQLN